MQSPPLAPSYDVREVPAVPGWKSCFRGGHIDEGQGGGVVCPEGAGLGERMRSACGLSRDLRVLLKGFSFAFLANVIFWESVRAEKGKGQGTILVEKRIGKRFEGSLGKAGWKWNWAGGPVFSFVIG